MYGVRYQYSLGESTSAVVRRLAGYAEEGKLKSVVGRVLPFERDLLREACVQIMSGKGGLGKVVIEMK